MLQARADAKEQSKWLIASLLSRDVFDSHRLNRDTWKDESMQALITSGFVFWQVALYYCFTWVEPMPTPSRPGI